MSNLHESVAIQEDKGGGGGREDSPDKDEEFTASPREVDSLEDELEGGLGATGDAALPPGAAALVAGVVGDFGELEVGMGRVEFVVVAFAFNESLLEDRETTSALYPETVCVIKFSNRSRFLNKAYVNTPFESYWY